MEKYTKEQHEQYVAEQEAKRSREEQERREAMEKESARQAWRADGGAAEDFEREWPRLRDEGRRRRVVDADKRARTIMRSSGVSSI